MQDHLSFIRCQSYLAWCSRCNESRVHQRSWGIISKVDTSKAAIQEHSTRCIFQMPRRETGDQSLSHHTSTHIRTRVFNPLISIFCQILQELASKSPSGEGETASTSRGLCREGVQQDSLTDQRCLSVARQNGPLLRPHNELIRQRLTQQGSNHRRPQVGAKLEGKELLCNSCFVHFSCAGDASVSPSLISQPPGF